MTSHPRTEPARRPEAARRTDAARRAASTGKPALPRGGMPGGNAAPAHTPALSAGAASAAIYHARQMLQLAHWAASAFATYDRASVLRIAQAVASTAHANAARYAEWAVRETGFGVVEHKTIKNEACSLGIMDRYRDDDLVSPRVDPAAKILALPRPAGVILALTPSTNPVCSVYFKVIIALLTRNAIVVSPHPMAKELQGPKGPEPTRYGDWENKGIASDF